MKNPDYMVDVAGERVYQNQSREYYDEYTKWRNNPDNKYGYAFQHDTREHIYVDGAGFADQVAVDAERTALFKCFQVLGIAMLIFFAFQLALFLVMKYCFDINYYGWVYYSEKDTVKDIPASQGLAFCIIKLLSYVTVMAFCSAKLKLPFKVHMPREKINQKFLWLSISAALIFMVISRVFDYIIVHFMQLARIDVCFYSYMGSESVYLRIFYAVTELALIPLFAELVFRGYFLQLLRQFGDYFAIIVAALLNAYYYHDITKMMFIFCLACILGYVTIRTGNIFSAVITRIFVALPSYIMTEMSISAADSEAYFWEIILSMLILAVAFTVYVYLRRNTRHDFMPVGDSTEMTAVQKMKIMLNSMPLVIWMIITLVCVILSVRFT